MRPKPQIPEEFEEHRDARWRREATAQVDTAIEAERFIEQVGFAFCLTDSRRPGPSLYVAVCGRRDAVLPRNVQKDPEASLTWVLKDELIKRGRVYYAKLARGRAMFVAPRMIPHFHAIWGVRRSDEKHKLSKNARAILKVLRSEWEMATSDLRDDSGVKDRKAFNQAMDELQAAMIVVPSEVFYQPKFTYIWTLGVGRFPDALVKRVRRETAVREIARGFLTGAGMTIPGELARVTGLSRPEAGRGNRALVAEGFAAMPSPGFYHLMNANHDPRQSPGTRVRGLTPRYIDVAHMISPRPLAIGCMRLSTEPDREEAKSIAVLHAAFDAGVTLLDTADAYCWDDGERGHNERLIAQALSTWSGDRSRITVATKGGLTRPDGRWEPDGRAKHLTAACEQSCRALGVERIDLYQLHAPDSRVPLSTSVRALARLKRDGLIGAIGLCNVSVGQIEEARRITDIASIQVEVSVWNDSAFRSGVVEYCIAHHLMLLAHRPLGGRKARARTAADSALNSVGARHDATPFEVALAWLAGLSNAIVPLPGVTRIETAQSAARAQRIELTDKDRAILDKRFPAFARMKGDELPPSHMLRRTAVALAETGRRGRLGTGLETADLRRDAGEVVLLMGLPGAGKTTLAQRFVADGYQRLNRDEAGGTLRDLLPDLDRALASGTSRIILDNTYLSRKSRADVIRAATERGTSVRCVWLSTSLENAQINAVERIVARYGKLPDERELTSLRTTDVAAFLPSAQFRSQRELEPPDSSEGFSRIEVMPFERRTDPTRVNRAVIVWCDDVLIRSRSGQRTPSSPEDVALVDGRAPILRRYQAEGWRVLGLSWQPEIADGTRSHADVDAVFARMNELIDLAVEVHYCPHGAGPPRCWCRKPLPGLGVLLMHRHQLDPARCIYVGDGPQDPGFARKLGVIYINATDFFAPQASVRPSAVDKA